ncbi:RNI-like protein [Mycena venus]|uniref:RNI-like protein n=1 Tax=Mycena venus TaxID=2733690 RepID=A0A8H6XEK1_9AGAR|nr:RNI-like protein [Mycena venus]
MATTLTQTAAPAAGVRDNLNFMQKRLQTAIDHNFLSAYVPDSINDLPRRRHSTTTVASQVAALLFPDFTQVKADIHYEIALSRARRVARQRERARVHSGNSHIKNDAIASETQGEWLGQEEDPISLDGPMALPMPVEIGTDDDFQDVFQFLHLNLNPKDVLSPEKKDMRDELTSTLGLMPGAEIKWNTPMVEFKRGVVYDDGRLDLCKMVVGPTHIEKLLDALERNTVVTQFLLGNNVISTTGARRIARFIVDHPERIETWYIAGNHIRAPGFQLLVDAMVNSSRITNVWLKRSGIL